MGDIANPQHVLLVEDDPVVGLILRRRLSDEGIACTHLLTLSDAETYMDERLVGSDAGAGFASCTGGPGSAHDAVILDYYMEDGNTTLALCAKIREQSNLPVIMLTGEASIATTVDCLEAGADQYVLKPFNADELLARLRASLRARLTANDRSSAALVEVDISSRVASFRYKRVELTEKEAVLAAELARTPGVEVSRTVLMERVCGLGTAVELSSRRLDMLVGRLRRKLSGLHRGLDILSARKYGYKLVLRNLDDQ